MRRIGIVAGEASGDFLGGELAAALRRRERQARFEIEGIGGPRLAGEGCASLAPIERLSVMGIYEVLGRLPELYRLRRRLLAHFLERRPDVFIGVDAPDFNLDLEAALRRTGVRTVHYVSPSVWAWRRYRLRKIAAAADRVLVLFPFEQELYRRQRIPVTWVGHPLADRIALEPRPADARRRLGLAPPDALIALMPGSRTGELQRHLRPFLLAAEHVRRARPGARFACSVLDDGAARRVREALRALSLDDLPLDVFVGRAHDVLEASDAALLASGTVTLEAMLFKRPMVVAYRMHALSYRLIRALVKVRFVALPNLLAGEGLVPECLQDACTPDRLARELLRWLDDARAAAGLRSRFDDLHRVLRRGASERAAAAVAEVAGGPP